MNIKTARNAQILIWYKVYNIAECYFTLLKHINSGFRQFYQTTYEVLSIVVVLE